MGYRYKMADLTGLVDRLNRTVGAEVKAYREATEVEKAAGFYSVANPGTFYLEGAYGGHKLVQVINYGSPRVANKFYADFHDAATGNSTVRYIVKGDPIVVLPECLTILCNYKHVGRQYVCIEDESHPLFGVHYFDLNLEVHGGCTFSEDSLPNEDDAPDGWWIGFDTGHAGDFIPAIPDLGGVPRSEQYVMGECEKLARQISCCISG
jgi:hypothetical protein